LRSKVQPQISQINTDFLDADFEVCGLCWGGEDGPVFAYGSAEVCAALRDFWLQLYAFLIENSGILLKKGGKRLWMAGKWI